MRLEYTYFNLILFVLTLIIRFPKFREFVTSSSVFVFIGWALVIIFYGYNQVIKFYRLHLNDSCMRIPLIVLIDFICHVLPVIVLGFPHDPIMFAAAACTVIVWYILVRHHIPKMYYLPIEHLVYRDAIVFCGFLVLLLFSFAF